MYQPGRIEILLLNFRNYLYSKFLCWCRKQLWILFLQDKSWVDLYRRNNLKKYFQFCSIFNKKIRELHISVYTYYEVVDSNFLKFVWKWNYNFLLTLQTWSLQADSWEEFEVCFALCCSKNFECTLRAHLWRPRSGNVWLWTESQNKTFPDTNIFTCWQIGHFFQNTQFLVPNVTNLFFKAGFPSIQFDYLDSTQNLVHKFNPFILVFHFGIGKMF